MSDSWSAEQIPDQSGRTAVVMGARVGNTIVAWTVQMHKATVSTPHLDDKDTQIEWSTSDPTVGVGRLQPPGRPHTPGDHTRTGPEDHARRLQ